MALSQPRAVNDNQRKSVRGRRERGRLVSATLGVGNDETRSWIAADKKARERAWAVRGTGVWSGLRSFGSWRTVIHEPEQ